MSFKLAEKALAGGIAHRFAHGGGHRRRLRRGRFAGHAIGRGLGQAVAARALHEGHASRQLVLGIEVGQGVAQHAIHVRTSVAQFFQHRGLGIAGPQRAGFDRAKVLLHLGKFAGLGDKRGLHIHPGQE